MTGNKEQFQLTDISNKATIHPVHIYRLHKEHINFILKQDYPIASREKHPHSNK